MPLPPDKLLGYDLTSDITMAERLAEINDLIADFNSAYGVNPNIVLLDSVVNAVYMGYYGS
jgi:hypothetical protein